MITKGELQSKLKEATEELESLKSIIGKDYSVYKEEIKILNKQLEEKGSLISSLKETIKDLEISSSRNVPEILTKEIVEDTLKEVVQVKTMDLKEEIKTELNSLNDFLKACYRESQSVSVKTNIYAWRKLLSELAQ